jgi:hypothetical protein
MKDAIPPLGTGIEIPIHVSTPPTDDWRLRMTGRGLADLGFFSLLTVTLVLGLTGCGSDGRVMAPTQAQVGAPLGAGPVLQKDDGDKLSSVSVVIDGAIGGVVELGRSLLTIPPGAFEGTKTITMVCKNDSGKECQLYPEGLQFARPVQLTIKLNGTMIDGPDATIYWWDPTAGVWVDMMGTYSASGHAVTADLHHFSIYCAGSRTGRAGW